MNKYQFSIISNMIQESLISINNNLDSGKERVVDEINKSFPVLSRRECEDIFELFVKVDLLRNQETLDLVVTVPHSFAIKSSPTSVTMENLLRSSQRNIIITGYSISEYFEDFINIIIEKITKGVHVQLYLNDYESKKEVLDKLILYKGKFLEIYNFNKSSSGIEALHAKVISIDGEKNLITSANLSFNGLQKNIEVGTLITSKRIANSIISMFKELYYMKYFTKI